jgi:flagellar hook-associated protein 2
MSPLPVLGSGSTSGITASALNQIIAQTMALQRQPLERLQAQRDELEVRRAVYNDLQTKLEALQAEAEKLISSSGSTVFGQKTVTSSDQSYVTATASASAAVGTYIISDVTLATVHRVRSGSFAYSNEPLGLSGTVVLGGATTRSAALTAKEGAPVAAIQADDTTAPAEGQTELGTDDYYVEFRQSGGVWQFRLVNSQGQAVSIADAGTEDSYTAGWQAYSDVRNTVYDTGRGLKITFADADPTGSFYRPDAPKISYQAQGASLTIEATDSLQSIRDKINSATYADGNGLVATIINNQLILTASRVGYTLEGSGDLLGASGLGLTGDGDGDGDGWDQTLTASSPASFKVNGLSITRYSNTNLSDVIDGLTLNLLKETEAGENITLTVADNTNAVTSQINAFIARFNDVTAYLAAKTAVTQNADGVSYKRGTLAGDTLYNRLRFGLISDLNTPQSGLSPTAPTSLREIGLTFDTELRLTLSDSSALQSALASNPDGVAELLDAVLSETSGLLHRIELFTGSTTSSGLLDESIELLDDERKYLTSRIKEMNTRLDAYEQMLTRRYATLLQQLAQVQSQSSYLAGLFTTFSSWG